MYKLEMGLKITVNFGFVNFKVGLTHGFFDQITSSNTLSDVLMSKNIKFVLLDIVLDEKFPFSSPMIFLQSQLRISLEFNDGRGK